ncbi:MAG: SulP family inorganic anion transporter, partial [Magnetococcales bacterium]|nr:SulP family inorganic anion transporter [Magnetococcales bacterium]
SLLPWLSLVSPRTTKRDLISGFTGAVVVLPQGVAFAAIAGLPPEYGLYTAMVPAIMAALCGSSHHLISGPTTAISIVVFSTLAPFADPGSAKFITMALTLSFITGLFQLAFGIGKLGVLVNFVSHSVVVGFTCGASILIATSQIKHLFGVQIPNGGSFIHTWSLLIEKIPDINPQVFMVGITTLVSALVIRWLRPGLPDMLIAMIIGSSLAAYLGVEQHHIALVGALPEGLPHLSSPDLSLEVLRHLTSSGLAIALLGLVEAVSIARSVGSLSGQNLNSNREFIGQGLSNVVGSFFSAYPSSGSFTRTGVNFSAGGKTPLSAIFSAFFLLGIVLLIAPLAGHLPIAAMAGVILIVAKNLIDFKQILSIIRTSKSESAVLLATFLSTLFFELEFAIISGVILSIGFFLRNTANPRVSSRVPNPSVKSRSFVTDPSLPECQQLKILRIDGPLYFGSIDHVEAVLRKVERPVTLQQHLLISCSGINSIDLAGVKLLFRESERRESFGGHLFLYDVKDHIDNMIKRTGHLSSIPDDHIFDKKNKAIRVIIGQHIDHDYCRSCPHHVFLECHK